MLDRERDRAAAEEQEEMLDQLVARIAPHQSSRRASIPPSSPLQTTGWARDKKGTRAAAAGKSRKKAQVVSFEGSSSEDDTAQQIAALKEELSSIKAERDFFQRGMLTLAKASDKPEVPPITVEGVKKLIQEAVKAGSAASTPKKKLHKAETDGLFGRVDIADDVYHTESGTAALLDLIKEKLQEANAVRDFSLGINIKSEIHNSCNKVGKAVAKYHFQLPEESAKLLAIRQDFFPTDTCKVPGTIMPLVFRALSSRNIVVKSEEVGADQDGDPIPLLAKE